MNSWYSNLPNNGEKLICAAFYAAVVLKGFGLIYLLLAWSPIIWILISNVKRLPMKDFVKYHCYQAFLLNMILSFLPQLLLLLMNILINILSLLAIFGGTIKILNGLTGFVLQVYTLGVIVLTLYAVIWTLRGKFTYIPPVSQAINLLLR